VYTWPINISAGVSWSGNLNSCLEWNTWSDHHLLITDRCMPKFQVIYSTTRRAWDRLCNLQVAVMERSDDDFYAVANKGSSLKLVRLLQLARSSSRGYYGPCWCISVCSRQVPKRPSLPRQVLTSPPSSPCVMMCGWSILWWFLNSSEGVLFFGFFFLVCL
jgi:hypothetical protein